MKIGIQTWGSHGDIRPFRALAEALQAAGHEVCLAITCVDQAVSQSGKGRAGADIRSVASPVARGDDDYARIGRDIFGEANPFRQARLILDRLLVPVEAEMYRAAEALCAQSDLVIGHYVLYPLAVAAEKAGRPYVSVVLSPMAIPSARRPLPGWPGLGRLGNRLAWRMAGAVLNAMFKRYPDALRRAHGLPPAGDLMRRVWASPYLTLVAASPVFCPPQPDWPGHVRACGFLDRPDDSETQTPAGDWESFLARGEEPLFMTFGSMMPPDLNGQKETAALLAEAARLAGCRALIQAPQWQECGLVPTDGVGYVRSVPHREVFPRCRAVVHHGGAGTTHAAARAGKPSVVVAHIAEQEFWGRELQRLGAAPGVLRRRQTTAARLAERLARIVQTETYRAGAARLAAAMKDEDGVAAAVRILQESARPQG